MNSSLEFEPEMFGEERSDKYRLFFKKILPSLGAPSAKIYISPFHDISLYSESGSNIYRMIVTQPRWTNVQYEMATDEPFNPILPVTQKDRISYVKNIFPFHGVPWNSGFLPQTWEMPSYESPHTVEGVKGTNNVLEIIEIGTQVHELGSVVDVKVLGAIAFLNNREITWKIISIDVNDSVASKLNEIGDVYTYMPNLIESTIEWIRYHKIPDGGQILQLANLERPFDQKSTYEKIETSHKFWKNLIKNEIYFRESRDCVHFKLLNTQCLEGNAENVKSGKEAEVIVENLKATIGGQLIEALPQYPSRVDLDTVFYIDKSEFGPRKHLTRNGDRLLNEEDENDEDDEENTSYWKSIKKIPFGKVLAPIALTSLAGYIIYYYAYKRSRF